MSTGQRSVRGTVLRGPDGNLYFIQDDALDAFRVFDSERSRIEGLLSGQAIDPTLVDQNQPQTEIDAVHTTITLQDPPSATTVGGAISQSLLPDS